jgi:hypothetical protein
MTVPRPLVPVLMLAATVLGVVAGLRLYAVLGGS